jgi:hypothetical protein
LVSIFFGEGDIVLEPLGHRDKYIVEDPEYLVAVSDIVRDDTDSKEIIEITRMRIGVVFARELAIDRERGLDAIGDIDNRDLV